jgi:hypothetical protein
MGEILINNSDSGGPISIAAIDNEFVVAWTESGIITCARFSAGGVRIGANFTVNTPDTPGAWAAMALIQTGFVVAWISGGNLLLQAGPRVKDVRLGEPVIGELRHTLPCEAVFLAASPKRSSPEVGHVVPERRGAPCCWLLTFDGVKNGAPLQVNPGSTRVSADPPGITRLADAGLVVCWGEAGQQVVRAQIFNFDLTKRGEAFTVKGPETVNSQVNIQPVITYMEAFDILKDGQPTDEIERAGFVIAWSGGPAIGETFSRFQFYDANGIAKGDPSPPGGKTPETMAKFDLFLRPGSLAPLPFPLGGFCGIQDHQSVLSVDAYDGKGNFQFSSNVTHFDDHTLSTLPAITATQNNGVMVITWEERSPQISGDQGTNIMTAMITTDLQVLSPLKVNTEPARGQTMPCVASVLTDNIAFAWVDRSLSTPPPLPSIKGRILAGGNLL